MSRWVVIGCSSNASHRLVLCPLWYPHLLCCGEKPRPPTSSLDATGKGPAAAQAERVAKRLIPTPSQ